MDAAYNVVYDSHNTQNFKSVYFGNSIVKMTVANKTVLFDQGERTHTQQLIRLDNNVFMPKRLCRELPDQLPGQERRHPKRPGFRSR